MNFYGINYLQTQSNLSDILKYIIIFSTLFLMIVVFSLYMRHRLQTKYRDLSIIALLFLLFISGVQYSEYTHSENAHSQSSQMVNFVYLIAKQYNTSIENIYSNSFQLSDGIIIKINEDFYKVNISNDQSAYELRGVWLMKPNVKILKYKDK